MKAISVAFRHSLTRPGPFVMVTVWCRMRGSCSRGYVVCTGGTQVVMCDASVQFIFEYVDYDVWQALGDRRDGRSVDAVFSQ